MEVCIVWKVEKRSDAIDCLTSNLGRMCMKIRVKKVKEIKDYE